MEEENEDAVHASRTCSWIIMTRKRTSQVRKEPDNPLSISLLSHVTAEAEKEHILRILKSTKGNKTRAAALLGISRKTLWEKLKTYDDEE